LSARPAETWKSYGYSDGSFPKVIADFRKDNGPAIRRVCASFVNLCRQMGLLAKASVAIDGSKFKAVNNRDRNFTRGKIDRRRAQLEESVARLSLPARCGGPAGTVRRARAQDDAAWLCFHSFCGVGDTVCSHGSIEACWA